MENFHFIQILVAASFLISLFWLERKGIDKIVFNIICLNFAVEITVSTLLTFGFEDVGIFYTLYTICHNTLWLLLITRVFKVRGIRIIAPYLLFCILNLILYEGSYDYNTYSFVIGGFIYVAIFIYQSFRSLQLEKFQFLLGLDYFLLFIPVLFFLGLSFYFGFKDSSLGDIKLIGELDLYKFVMNFVNFVYYSLLVVYVIKRGKSGR